MQNISELIINGTLNLSEELRGAGAYGVCIQENWSPNMLAFSLLNVVTIIIMMVLHKKGHPGRADRLVNILFIFNVFALAMNAVIMLGFKFLP